MDVTNSTGNLCTNSTTGIPAYQCPPGAVTVTNNGGPVVDVGAPSDYSSTYSLNSQGYAEDQYIQLPGGTDNLSVTYAPHPIAPNNSYNASTGTASISISAAPTSTVLSSSATTVTSGQSVTLTATVNTTSLGVSPTGTVAFYNGSTQIGGGTVTYAPASASAFAYASLTATLTTSFTANASITAAYTSADQNYSSSTTTTPLAISISGGKADFSLTATPSSFTITSPGASGSTSISASAIASFTGTISLACSLSAAMTYSSCSMPADIILTGGHRHAHREHHGGLERPAAPDQSTHVAIARRRTDAGQHAALAAVRKEAAGEVGVQPARFRSAGGSLGILRRRFEQRRSNDRRHADGDLHGDGNRHQRQSLAHLEYSGDCAVAGRESVGGGARGPAPGVPAFLPRISRGD